MVFAVVPQGSRPVISLIWLRFEPTFDLRSLVSSWATTCNSVLSLFSRPRKNEKKQDSKLDFSGHRCGARFLKVGDFITYSWCSIWCFLSKWQLFISFQNFTTCDKCLTFSIEDKPIGCCMSAILYLYFGIASLKYGYERNDGQSVRE